MSTIKRILHGAAGPVLAGVLLASGAGLALAGTSYTNFSTTVGKFNGNGYTNNQTKASSGAAANVTTSSVGGNYVVDARVQYSDGNGSGPWARNLSDGSSRLLTNGLSSGRSTRVQFSNDITTRVDMQVSGRWRSN